MFPFTQFVYRKSVGKRDALITISNCQQQAQEHSAAFKTVKKLAFAASKKIIKRQYIRRIQAK